MARRHSGSEETIEVSVAVLGSAVTTFVLPKDSTVEDALEAGGYSLGSRVKISGEEVDLDDILENGDRLVVTEKVKGGSAK